MKIRTGFVSNSSSSSFVFSFSTPPKTLGELIDLFGAANASYSQDLWHSMSGPFKPEDLAAELDLNWSPYRSSDRELLESFIKNNPGRFFYVAEFGDNHGDVVGERGDTLEREGLEIFDRVPVISFNNH